MRVIIFDLDGTLTDPEEGICESVRYALTKGGYPVGSREQYHPWIGPPLLRSFIEYAGVDEAEALRLLGFYRERFSTVGLFENRVYPGIPELLRELKAAGNRLMVATGKPAVFSERILEHFGLLAYFDTVSGISLSETPMDKQGVITAGLLRMGVTDRTDCVMVGDLDQDVEGARLCGLPCIYVLYGYGSREEALRCGAAQIAESVSELRAILME